jgi:hypothetical protein
VNDERAILEAIAFGGDGASAGERLRAIELLRDLDAKDRADFYAGLEAMGDDGLDAVEEWFREPLTVRERAQREADVILQDDARFNKAVHRLARKLARHEKRSQTPQDAPTPPERLPNNVEHIDPHRRSEKSADVIEARKHAVAVEVARSKAWDDSPPHGLRGR